MTTAAEILAPSLERRIAMLHEERRADYRNGIEHHIDELEYHIQHMVTQVDVLTLKRTLDKMVDEAEESYQDHLGRPDS